MYSCYTRLNAPPFFAVATEQMINLLCIPMMMREKYMFLLDLMIVLSTQSTHKMKMQRQKVCN